MNRQLTVAASALLLLGPASLVLGQDDATNLTTLKSMSIEQIMQIDIPTVFGASKHDQKITEAPSSVTIVTREEIQAYGQRTLGDVLNSVRDFYVADDLNFGYIGVRGVNRPGDFGGRILVLIDGLRVNEPITDSAGVMDDFPIDVDMIERVEVIRGPGSALYGNNAFFAVINVITRSAADVNGAEVSSEGGSWETYKTRLTFGHVFTNGISALLTGTVFGTAGNPWIYFKEYNQPANHDGVAKNLDGDSSQSVGLTLSYRDFTLQGGYVSRFKDVPTTSYHTIFGDPNKSTIDQRSYSRLVYAHEFDNDLTVRASIYCNSFYYLGDNPVALNPAAPHEAFIFHTVADAVWGGAELQVSKQVFKTHELTLGAECQDNANVGVSGYFVAPVAGTADVKTDPSTYGLFVQDEWAITGNLTLDAGMRYDWLDRYGSTANPRAAMIWHPWDKTTLKALYGQAYRAPNVYESSFAPPVFRPSVNLLPERVHSYELALEQTLTPKLRLSSSVFYNQMNRLISEQLYAPTDQIYFANGGPSETIGGSIELEAKLPLGIKGRVSYTCQRTTDTDTGGEFSNSPENLAKLGLIVPLYRDKIFSGLEVQYTSPTVNTLQQTTGGYVLVNCNLFSHEIIKHLEVSASVHNLLDAKYAIPGSPSDVLASIPQDGRTFLCKLTYKF